MKKIKLPLVVKVLIAIVLGILFGQFMPGPGVRVVNTLVGIFDQLLRFFIPLIIIGLVTPAIADFGQRAGKMLLITVGLAYLFTVCSGLFAYGFSTGLFPFMLSKGSLAALETAGQEFAPYFTIAIPPLADVMTSLVLSFMLGLGIAFTHAARLHHAFEEVRNIVVLSIEKVIIPLLPFYIFGLFLDMAAAGKVGPVGLTMTVGDKVMPALIGNDIGCGVTVTQIANLKHFATIPVTLRSAIGNGVREEVAGFTVPLCATIHLSGSTLKITSCAIALMLMLDMPFDFGMILGFVLMLGVTMVAAPGVPGGAIMAALGVLGSILGFDATQQALMITLYIAMDSFGTACNVTGDGAIALIVDRIAGKKV